MFCGFFGGIAMDYQTEKNMDYTMRLRAILKELPEFCGLYFRAAETTTGILTRYGYAVDLRSFFTFLVSGEVDCCKDKTMRSLTLSELNQIRPIDIEKYMEHISLYIRNNKRRTNDERAKARKLAAIRSFFKYYYKQELIDS